MCDYNSTALKAKSRNEEEIIALSGFDYSTYQNIKIIFYYLYSNNLHLIENSFMIHNHILSNS